MKGLVQRKNKNWLSGLLKTYTEIAGKEVAVGYPKEKQQAYPDGESVAEVAAKHVFGIGVVQRDFMTYALDEIEQKTRPILDRAVLALNRNQNQAAFAKLLEAAGLVGSQAIKNAIINGLWTPNSNNPMGRSLAAILSEKWQADVSPTMSYREAKQKYRGSDKPLIDTAHMVNAATYVVRDAE